MCLNRSKSANSERCTLRKKTEGKVYMQIYVIAEESLSCSVHYVRAQIVRMCEQTPEAGSERCETMLSWALYRVRRKWEIVTAAWSNCLNVGTHQCNGIAYHGDKVGWFIYAREPFFCANNNTEEEEAFWWKQGVVGNRAECCLFYFSCYFITCKD